ncbi:MAG: DNA repair protein RecO [Microcoleaceae cyanobacterium]
MNQTYRATGINLKGMPLNESDRLLTVLTREHGLVRMVAQGARKPKSQLGGRTDLFVVNQLLIRKGRSLDKLYQAETVKSYGKLSRNLGKLAAGQYLAELVLTQALSDQPQEELFLLLSEHLDRLENLPNQPGVATCNQVLACLAHGIFHLLAFAGVAPQFHLCCRTQSPIIPEIDDVSWKIGFSITAGGVITLNQVKQSQHQSLSRSISGQIIAVSESPESSNTSTSYDREIKINYRLNSAQIVLLQQLTHPVLSDNLQSGQALGVQRVNLETPPSLADWILIEQLLRQYAEYHLGRGIRSALLIDTYTQQSQMYN